MKRTPSANLLQEALASLRAGNFAGAERHLSKALKANPRDFGALNLIGALLAQQERWAEAETYLKRALRENAGSDATFYNYGLVLRGLRRPLDAIEQFNRALAINPSVADTWNSRGVAYNDLGRYLEALADFDKAISINPKYVQACSNRGNSLENLQLHDKAMTAYREALELAPGLAEAWLGLGSMYLYLQRHEEALNAYDKAHVLKPSLGFPQGGRLHAKQQMCDWSNLEAETSRLLSAIRKGELVSVPFSLLSLPASPQEQFRCARSYALSRPSFAKLWTGDLYDHDRIRVAYLSSDFREHPVAAQIVGLLTHHDRQRFEITTISTGADDRSHLRERIASSSDHFVDAHLHGDHRLAELIRSAEIDILVDLNGLTTGGHQEILGRRPAPIQINYLGYAGTTGTDNVDYIVGDSVVIPPQDFAFYSEKVVWLPGSYMVNDDQRKLPEGIPTRSECGLPEQGPVFCCFNGAYKITPDVFDVWMRLLRGVENSVLWLSSTNAISKTNLLKEARQRGVAPERLIFAPRLASTGDHLARHRQADLFLDTLPYNAHSTASDALWTGLPVLTVRGKSFPGRVAASLLTALDLSELVTDSLQAYEAAALRLAQDQAELQTLKDKLARSRLEGRLFNTARFARHLEAAYETMHSGLREGRKPAAFEISRAD
jgi:predicted O-linked N-acetylglucosamine transferase (SPINDLY family)